MGSVPLEGCNPAGGKLKGHCTNRKTNEGNTVEYESWGEQIIRAGQESES